MYEQLLNLAEQLNDIAFNARCDGKMNHERFVEAMDLVSWMIGEAEKIREKELD